VILVAGGSGFIGAAAVRRLVAEGEDVGVMTAHVERSRPRVEGLGAKVVPGDIRESTSLQDAVSGAESVVQALTFPSFPVQKPRKGYTFAEFEGRGTARLVEAAAAAGARKYVYVSGAGAAPDATRVWFRAKWIGEESVRAADVDHVILRPSWVYGPEDRALNTFVAFHRWFPFVPVIGDGTQRLQPVFVDDVARAIAQAARPGGLSGTFEIGGPEVFTMDEVLQVMMHVRGKRRPLVHLPAWLPKLAGLFLQHLPKPPLSPEAVDFATGDAIADTAALLDHFDLTLTPLREGLATYLSREAPR
jgi:NADH dehydrogenase